MRGKQKNKKFLVVAIVLMLLISIGYATISTTLRVNGSATIKSQSWSVYFTNIVTTTGGVTPTTAPTASGTTTTTLTWAVSLNTPGQFYEFTVDVVNDGSIDAMIGSLSNSTLTTDQAKYLNYTVTYSDGAQIEQYDKLEAGDTETLKVRVEFKSDPEQLPSTASAISLTYTSNYVQADTNAKARNTVTPPTPPASLDIGDTVNYTTTLNGQTLSNWKVFYIDGDYTYIILDNYLPNTAISESMQETYNIEPEDGTTYRIYASDKADLINAMATKQNWDSLLTGSINGNAVSETRTADVWAMGAPTLDLWVNSWNANTGYTTLYTADDANGYYVGDSANPTTTYIDLSSETGHGNSLYFLPYYSYSDSWDEDDICTGYRLASPSADGEEEVMNINYDGKIGDEWFDGLYGYSSAFRPVICLPSSVVNQ